MPYSYEYNGYAFRPNDMIDPTYDVQNLALAGQGAAWGPAMDAFRNSLEDFADGDLSAPHSSAQAGDFTLHKMREGIERFMITDINNPAGSAQGQSEIVAMWDSTRSFTNNSGQRTSNFNHIPGGANVLYMDGHVEFAK